MLCHDGKVSLASFISGVITTIFTSTLTLIILSLELNTFQNVLLCFVGPIGIYAFFCVIAYFVTNKNDFSVFIFIHLHKFKEFLLIMDSLILGNKKSNGTGFVLWTVYYQYHLCTKCMETIWNLLFIHVNISLQRVLNNLICQSANIEHGYIFVEPLNSVYSGRNK